MNQDIINLYNKLVFNYNKLNTNELYNLNTELYLLSLSLYLKNLTKDPRSIYQLKEILQEEFKDSLYGRHNSI